MSPVLTSVAQAAHSIIAPSSAARRVQCSQSTTLEALFPETEESPEAAEGVGAHWAVSEQVAGRLVDVGQIAPNNVVLTEDMCRAADLMYDDIAAELAPYGLKPSDGQVEQRVAIPRVHPQSWGTPDYWIIVAPPGRRPILFIYDFKYGHRIVEAYQNPQLVEYIAGITHGVNDLSPGLDIVAKIVQPRAPHREGPVRAWKTTLLDLRALINISSTAAHEALGPNPRARTGPECRDCRARHACPQLQAAGLAGMDEAKHVVPLKLAPKEAALELAFAREAIELLSARASGLEAQLEAAIKRGEAVPGWRIEHGPGRTQWQRPAAEVIAMGEALGLKLAKPAEPVTPLQAKEAGLDPAIVAAMSRHVPGAAKLVKDDGTLGRRLFG